MRVNMSNYKQLRTIYAQLQLQKMKNISMNETQDPFFFQPPNYKDNGINMLKQAKT